MTSGEGFKIGQLTLNYRDKVDAYSQFELCIRPGQDFKGTNVGKGAFQFGYKTYGFDHYFERGQ